MSQQAQTGWLRMAPSLPEQPSGEARRLFTEHAARLARASKERDQQDDAARITGLVDPSEDPEEDRLDRALSTALSDASRLGPSAALTAALGVLTDLARQGWLVRVSAEGEVDVRRPDSALLDPLREKVRIKAQEMVKRNEQLRERATIAFVRSMEKPVVRGSRLTSIFSLLRDGRELVQSLRKARSLPPAALLEALRGIIDPYLQFVDDASECEHTGLRLQEIWRYFRHTWTNQYTSTPGRTMAFLVRDRARQFHPVIGIGAIGSPIVQIRERDEWIGWHPDAFLDAAAERPTTSLGQWLIHTVDVAISEIFVDDFVEERLIDRRDLRSPSAEVLARLVEFGDAQRKLHHRLVASQDLKRVSRLDPHGSTEEHWRERAVSHLYRSKRALSLCDLLRSRQTLRAHLSERPTADEVRVLAASAEGRRAVRAILRKAKADRVGIAMADITVCGAVAPYNPLLGGKLVSMLAASPEVIAAYRRKYSEQESEIASSMAGRPIVRPSQLVFLGTTSLYGVGSSQYNRLRMPAERLGGEPGEQLAFLEIGKSEAYGTSHFSSDTVDALVTLIQQSKEGQRVNSIFGEGVSPKLRKVRQGLEALKLPTDALLQHGRQRIVYGVPVVRNLQAFLLGMDDEPRYIFDTTEPAAGTAEIARWWTERWLSKRIMSDEALTQVAAHTLVRPVRHGARVPLPAPQDHHSGHHEDQPY